MVSQQIIDYIEKTRKAGYTETQIRDTLKKAGWNDSDIDEARGVKSQIIAPQPNSSVKIVASEQAQKASDNNKTSTFAIIALICAFILPLIGLILGIIALKQINKTGEKGKAIAIIAVVVSLINGLMVSLMLIASLAYFGVLDPGKMQPDRTQSSPGMDTMGMAVITSSDITFALRSNLGWPILIERVDSLKCTGATLIAIGQTSEFTTLNNNQVNNNDIFKIKLTGCNNGKTGQKIEDSIKISYQNIESGLSNQARVDVIGRVS